MYGCEALITLLLYCTLDLSPKRTPRLVQAYQSSQCILVPYHRNEKHFPKSQPVQYKQTALLTNLLATTSPCRAAPVAEPSRPSKNQKNILWRWYIPSTGDHWETYLVDCIDFWNQHFLNSGVGKSKDDHVTACLKFNMKTMEHVPTPKSEQRKVTTHTRTNSNVWRNPKKWHTQQIWTIQSEPLEHFYKNKKTTATSKTIFQGACSFFPVFSQAAPRDAYSGFSVAQENPKVWRLHLRVLGTFWVGFTVFFWWCLVGTNISRPRLDEKNATCGECTHRCTQWYTAWRLHSDNIDITDRLTPTNKVQRLMSDTGLAMELHKPRTPTTNGSWWWNRVLFSNLTRSFAVVIIPTTAKWAICATILPSKLSTTSNVCIIVAFNPIAEFWTPSNFSLVCSENPSSQ